MPQDGRRAKITIRIAIVYPASAALPKPARILTRPIQLAVPTSDWKIAAPDSLRSASIVFGSSARCSRRIAMRPVPRARVTSWRTTARPRPVVVATAAPVTPSAGNGPSPKMRHGSRTRLHDVREPQDAHRDRRVARAAEDRVDEEEEDDHDVPAEHHGHEPRARRDDVRPGAHEREETRREDGAEDADGNGDEDAERDRLHGRPRPPVRGRALRCGARPSPSPPSRGRSRRSREPRGSTRSGPRSRRPPRRASRPRTRPRPRRRTRAPSRGPSGSRGGRRHGRPALP